MNEIRRFNKERRQDLVEMLKGFVLEQVVVLSFNMFFFLCAVICTSHEPFELFSEDQKQVDQLEKLLAILLSVYHC
jgi:hypothetical protein